MQVASPLYFPFDSLQTISLVGSKDKIRSADALIGISILFFQFIISRLVSFSPEQCTRITNTQYEYIYTRIGRAFPFSWSLPEVSLFRVILKMPSLFRFTHHTSKRSTHVMVYQCNIYSMRYRFFYARTRPTRPPRDSFLSRRACHFAIDPSPSFSSL